MKVGTKSLLFGVHQVIIHPIFVLVAWIKLYNWPNSKELICIIIHDWGYWKKSNMDGTEGEQHPKLAATYANKWLDTKPHYFQYRDLCLYHSRFLSQQFKVKPSKLCWADKLGTATYPTWLWVFLARLSGELKEYMTVEKHIKNVGYHTNPQEFFKQYKKLVKTLIEGERR